ncbi:hypothetical protein SDC9_110922 [bioreactor metagenome]|uniref:RecJ OB domain-containing protein n=1 Tax=bioreactor metagenome TaxID=1076179 RepID=A0A645BFX0_9ZZZZ
MVSVLEVDAEIDHPDLLTLGEVEALAALEPHGAGNPRPVFTLSGMAVTTAADVGGGRHLKLRLQRDGRALDGIFFSATAAQYDISPGDRVDVAFYPQINEFRGIRSVQLLVADLRPALTRAQAEQALYEKLLGGENLSSRQARSLLPSRAEFAGVWRYLQAHAPGGRLEASACRLSRGVACTYGLPEAPCRTLICLSVLDECGLICLERRADILSVRMLQPSGKVDLERSATLRRLRAMAE